MESLANSLVIFGIFYHKSIDLLDQGGSKEVSRPWTVVTSECPSFFNRATNLSNLPRHFFGSSLQLPQSGRLGLHSRRNLLLK